MSSKFMSGKFFIIKKTIFVLLASLLISGCVTGPEGYLKRSANNKIFDTKGFKGGKRTPLYNKKYITRAKKNVSNGQYDDDEFLFDPNSEEEDISLANREMYREMVREDQGLSRGRNRKGGFWSLFSSSKKSDNYPVTNQASHMISQRKDSRDELKEELAEIRSMLNEARKDMASYKCPTASDLEGEFHQTKGKYHKEKQHVEDSMIRGQDDEVIGTEIVDPVHSI